MNIKHSNRFNSSPVIMFIGPRRQDTRPSSPILHAEFLYDLALDRLNYRMNSANFRENNSRAAYLTRQTRFPTSRDVANHGDREEDFPGRKKEFPSARFRVNHVSGGKSGRKEAVAGEGEAGSLFFLANSTRIAR